MQVSLIEYDQANNGFGALENYSIALCALASMLAGFYSSLTVGQNYLLLTTLSQTFLFVAVWEPEFLTFFQ